tara:strand:+ start:93 stop:374 length:282 start_codon:yes stop_codon:yes gene_type:complete
MAKTQSSVLQTLALIIQRVEVVEVHLIQEAPMIMEHRVVQEVVQVVVDLMETLAPLTLQFFKDFLVVMVIPLALIMEVAEAEALVAKETQEVI